MTPVPNPLETFWDDLLSSEPERIRDAFYSLDADTQAAVRLHLQRMISEDDWHPLQQASARAALAALDQPSNPSARSSKS